MLISASDSTAAGRGDFYFGLKTRRKRIDKAPVKCYKVATIIMSYRIVFIDAFTTIPLFGNPCAVIPEADGLDESRMQQIAKESNQPESAFVFDSSTADFKVCYFTPRQRIPFAGHPTIATAFLLALDGRIAAGNPTVVDFEFDIGTLPVEVYFDAGGRPSRVVMNQPQPVFGSAYNAGEVAAGFNLGEQELLPSPRAQVVSTGVPFLIIPVRNLAALKKAEMNRPALRELLNRAEAAAAFLFCLEGFSKESDTHARLLDPDGTLEDPFTGSASGCMGAFIVHHGMKPGPFLRLEQGHLLGRPGEGVLEVQVGEHGIESIKLAGSAVKTLEGTLLIESQQA